MYVFSGKNGRQYLIKPLTREVAQAHAQAILDVHNIIPHVHWTSEDLLADRNAQNIVFLDKWRLSYLVLCEGKVIGVLVAYKRRSAGQHPLRAIYIHRLAVHPDHQSNGIGRHTLTYALEQYAQQVPDYKHYSVQTNDNTANRKVIQFYENVGFKRLCSVYYPDKVDVLMSLEKSELPVYLRSRLRA